MPLCLLAGEPEAGPWRTQPLTTVAAGLMRLGQDRGADHRPVVLAIDGRSSGGKTTLAGRLRGAVAGSAVVHTDDIAWERVDLIVCGTPQIPCDPDTEIVTAPPMVRRPPSA